MAGPKVMPHSLTLYYVWSFQKKLEEMCIFWQGEMTSNAFNKPHCQSWVNSLKTISTVRLDWESGWVGGWGGLQHG